METCKLCKERVASKLNSHIITWSLIKDLINQPGFKERGYDVTFGISAYNAPSVYVGRSVLPEHIEKITKRNIEENVVDFSNDPFSRDKIFCPTCETNLSKLEDEFISKIYSKLDQVHKWQPDKKGNKKLLLSNYEAKLSYLFAYSIFFRTSIVAFNNYILDIKIENHLRVLLLSILTDEYTDLIQNINTLNEYEFKYPLMFCFLESDVNSGLNENMIIQNHSDKPYFIWADKIIFMLFQKENHIKSSVEYFYGLTQMVNLKEYFKDKWLEEMNFCILSDKNRKKMVLNSIENFAERNMNNMKSLFNHVCKKLLNRNATVHEKNLFGYHYSIISTEKFHNTVNEAFVKAIIATFHIKD